MMGPPKRSSLDAVLASQSSDPIRAGQIAAQTGNDEFLPDFRDLITELQKIRRNPNATDQTIAEADNLIERIKSGDEIEGLAYRSFNDLIGGSGPLGKIAGPVFRGLEFLQSAGASQGNQLGLLAEKIGIPGPLQPAALGLLNPIAPIYGAGAVAGIEREDRPANRLGLAGFLAGTSAGSDQLSGISPTGLPTEFSGLLGSDLRLPFLTNLPDLDTIANIGFEIATDPLTYTRLPGIVDDAAGATASGRSVRAGKDINAQRLLERAEAQGLRPDTTEAVLRSVQQGNIKSLVRDARSEGRRAARAVADDAIDPGVIPDFTPELLDRLGVQRRLNYGGIEIPGTEGIVAALGKIRTGATAGSPLSVIGQAGNLTGQATTRFLESVTDQGLRFSFTGQTQRRVAAIRAATVSRGLLAEGGDYAKKALADVRIGGNFLREISETELRSYIEETAEAIRQGLSPEAVKAAANKTKFQKALDDIVRWFGDLKLNQINDVNLNTSGTTHLNRFIADTTLSPTTRLIGPQVLQILKSLDSAAIARFSRAGTDSFSFRQLLGDGVTELGIINRRGATLLQLADSVATINVLGNAAETGFEGFTKTLFNVGARFEEAAALAGTDAVTLARALRESAEKIDEFAGPAIPTPADLQRDFQNLGDAMVGKALTNLADNTAWKSAAQIELTTAAGQKHLNAWRKLIHTLTVGVEDTGLQGLKDTFDDFAGQYALDESNYLDVVNQWSQKGKAIFAHDQKYGARWTARAERMSDNTLFRETDRIMSNSLFNPEIAALPIEANPLGVIGIQDRAVLAVAARRDLPRLLAPLEAMEEWFGEWARITQDVFTQYDATFTPEVAAVLKDIETVMADALLHHRVFGVAAQSALGRNFDDILKAETFFTAEQATDLSNAIMDFHVNMGGTDFFGTSPGQWGLVMHDTSQFLNTLKRAHFSNPRFDRIFGKWAQANRIFQNSAVWSFGHPARNAQGIIRLNYLGAKVTPAVYNRWDKTFDNMLAALADDTARFLKPGTSPLWKKIPKDQRDIARAVGASKIPISSSSGGNLLDRSLEVQERAFGSRVLGKVNDKFAAGKNRMEQMVLTGTRSAVTGRPRVRNTVLSQEGLQYSTRQELETWGRSMMAFAIMERGGSIDEAILHISRYHFDYWDLSHNGQKAAEVFPFYVFRARMIRLAAEIVSTTPGVGLASLRLRNNQKEQDPFGAGQLDRWTFGAGTYRGITYNLDPSDPLDEGYGALGDAARALTSLGNTRDFFRDQIVDPITPLLPIKQLLLLSSSGREFYQDEEQQLAALNGIQPRLMEQIDRHIPFLADFLVHTGNLERRNGQLYGTREGMTWITNVLPLLGTIERASSFSEVFHGEKRRQDPDNLKDMRETLNSLFTFSGFPFELVSPDQRQQVVNRLIYDARDFNFDVASEIARETRQETRQAAVQAVTRPTSSGGRNSLLEVLTQPGG